MRCTGHSCGAALSLLLGAAAFAQSPPSITVWKAPPEIAGDWHAVDNWTAALPSAGVVAVLVNGSTALIEEGSAVAKTLQLTHSWGGTIVQSGGRLTVDERLQVFNGEYRLQSGQLSAAALDLGGARNLQEFYLIDLTGVPLPETDCTPTEEGLCLPPLVLMSQHRRFSVDGGTATVQNELYLSQAQLEVSGGLLHAGSIYVDSFGEENSNPEVKQTGGFVASADRLQIQDGTYELLGGELVVGQLSMGDPTIPASWISVSRTPGFVQTGGAVHVIGDLEMCIPGFIWNPIPVQPITDVTYRLHAGSLIVDGNTTVGSLGMAPVSFLQTGGSHAVGGTLRIEGERSEYRLGVGELHAGVLEVGANVFNQGGTLSLEAPSASVAIETRMTLGAEANFSSSLGGSLRLDGADLEILGNNANRLAGLASVALVIEGGATWSTLEAASRDEGAYPGAFLDNFCIGTLQVGGDVSGRLHLVDEADNHPAGGLAGAVYVDRLIVAQGSSLDLGGLQLYYRSAEISGTVIESGGAMFAMVPEPEASLLIVASALCLRRLGKPSTDRRRNHLP